MESDEWFNVIVLDGRITVSLTSGAASISADLDAGDAEVLANRLLAAHREVVGFRPLEGKRRRIFERDGWRCTYCGTRLTRGVNAEIDHNVPLSRGGTDLDNNRVACCSGCNSIKGTQTGSEFRAMVRP